MLTFAISVGKNSLLVYRQLLLVLFDKVFDVDNAASLSVGCLRSHGDLANITILLLGAGDLECGIFNDLVCNGLLHEVDLTLPDQFHVDIGERNLKLLSLGISQAAKGPSRTSAVDALLHRGIDQKRVRFCAEVKVLCEGALTKPHCVDFHLKKVVLAFPDERDALELPKSVPLELSLLRCGAIRCTLCQHEVED